jgi:hypothetical protein
MYTLSSYISCNNVAPVTCVFLLDSFENLPNHCQIFLTKPICILHKLTKTIICYTYAQNVKEIKQNKPYKNWTNGNKVV